MQLHLNYIRGQWRSHWQSVRRDYALSGVGCRGGVLFALSMKCFSLPKAKTRKYDEAYVALGFTHCDYGGRRGKTVCLLCLKMLAADSMKPNKWRRHLKTLHPTHADKTLEFLRSDLGCSRSEFLIHFSHRHFKKYLFQDGYTADKANSGRDKSWR